MTTVKPRPLALALALALLATLCGGSDASAQEFGESDRSRGKTMLNVVKKDIQKNYYDPAFRNIDLDARFKAAEERISKAQSNSEIFGVIAQALADLKDSHTVFYPPPRTVDVEYGWEMRAIGSECYAIAVQPGSDADKKGLRVGDRVLSVDGRTPSRSTVWLMNYFYYALRPQPGMKLAVQSPGAAPRQLEVVAKITKKSKLLDFNSNVDIWREIREAEKEARLTRHRYYRLGEEALVWQMPQFDLDDRDVDKLVGEARGRKALVLDLRGNGGGRVDTLERLISNVFDRDITVATVKGRDKTEPLVAKTRGGDAFKGKLVVLIDSRSGSASEIFARVVQLEKRGTVIGDRSAGAVMRSRFHPHGYGSGTSVFYSVSVTDADMVMADGKSLEGVGVAPDELLLPRPEDMAAGLDTVLARAAQLAGFELDAKQAGAMFPVEWR
jgi:C-terminal processing protease CtpA/Prc